MIWRRTAGLSVGLLIGVTLALSPRAAMAAEAPDDVPDGMQWTPSTGLTDNVLETDADYISKQLGKPYSEVLAQLQAAKRRDAPLAELEEDPGYGGGYWDGDDLVLMYKGSVPASVLKELRSKSNVNIRSEAVKHSLEDLDRIRDEVAANLRADGVTELVTGLDPRAQKVIVAIRATGASRRDALRAKAVQGTPDGIVSVNFSDGALVRPHETFGGAEATGIYFCTTGFSVTKDSNSGITVNGHCGTDMDEYTDFHTGAVHSMTFKGKHEGQWGDIAWYTTGGAERDDFYFANDSSRRDVTGVKASNLIDQSVRGYGRGGPGGYAATVKLTGVDAGTWEKLACLDWEPSVGGDSGGPIFSGGAAYGTIFGGVFINNKWRTCFSQARYFDEAIGVTVKN